MKYIFYNFKHSFKNEKMILIIMLVCIVTSSFIINFSYGLYQNYNVIKEEEESELTEIGIIINDNSAVTKEKIKECVFSISDKTNDAISMYVVFPIIKEFYNMQSVAWNRVTNRFTVKSHRIMASKAFAQKLEQNGNMISGEYFTDEQETKGELVAIVCRLGDIDPDCTERITTRVEGGKRWVEIQNKEFEVIGYHKQLATPYFPFESLDDSTTFQDVIGLIFYRPITKPQYSEVKSNFESRFGSAVSVPEMEIPESENYYLYNTIIVISILISLLAAINFAVLYKYILFKRTKKLAIFRICGCTKAKAFAMFITECMLLVIPLFLATTFLYDRFVLPKLGNHFEYIETAYSFNLYMLIFVIYTAVSLTVLSFMISGFLRKSIREAKEEK